MRWRIRGLQTMPSQFRQRLASRLCFSRRKTLKGSVGTDVRTHNWRRLKIGCGGIRELAATNGRISIGGITLAQSRH